MSEPLGRDALVDGALQVFAQHGYRVPVRTIASELGVTTGAIYHYFGGKRELFLAGLRRSVGADEAEIVVPGPEVDVATRARLFAAAAQARESTWIVRILTLHEFVRTLDGPAPDVLLAAMDRYAAGTAAFLGSDDPQVGVLANNWVTGLVLRRHLDGGRTRWEDQVELFVTAIRAVIEP